MCQLFATIPIALFCSATILLVLVVAKVEGGCCCELGVPCRPPCPVPTVRNVVAVVHPMWVAKSLVSLFHVGVGHRTVPHCGCICRCREVGGSGWCHLCCPQARVRSLETMPHDCSQQEREELAPHLLHDLGEVLFLCRHQFLTGSVVILNCLYWPSMYLVMRSNHPIAFVSWPYELDHGLSPSWNMRLVLFPHLSRLLLESRSVFLLGRGIPARPLPISHRWLATLSISSSGMNIRLLPSVLGRLLHRVG